MMDAAARLSSLLAIADAFQARFEDGDLLTQMRAAEPYPDYRQRWASAVHLALTERVYRLIIVARTRQVPPGVDALHCALLWFAAVWGAVDWAYPRSEELRTGWPASIAHPFIPRPPKSKKEAA